MRKEKLGDNVAIRTGKLDANASSPNGEYPFFTCSRTPLKIDKYSYDCECVLVAGNGDLNVKYYSGKFDAYQRTYIIKSLDTQRLDNKYLYYFLDKYVEKLRELSIGGIIKYIKLENLTDAQIVLLPISDQNRIATELDTICDAIVKQKQQLKLCDNLIKSKFNEMFGDPVTNPMGWEIKKLNVICDVRDGTHDSPKYAEKGYPLITSKNVSGGALNFSQVNFITKQDYDNINKRSKVDKGDILMPMIGTVGNPTIVDVEPSFAIKNMALIKFNKTNVLNSYIIALLSSQYFETKVREQTKGGTQKFLSLGMIRNLSIIVPPINLQQQFADFVTQVEQNKGKIKQALSKTEILYKALMQKYFKEEENK